MWRSIVIGLGGMIVVVIALSVVFVVSMRAKFRPVQNAVRRMNRALWNPRSMKTAGKAGAYASVIRHVGRKSGTLYETPVGAVATDDGFVIALPYGANPDWLRNVMAAGSAVIVNEGTTVQVEQPELVSASVGNLFFPPKDQRSHRWFGVDEFLMLRSAGAG